MTHIVLPTLLFALHAPLRPRMPADAGLVRSSLHVVMTDEPDSKRESEVALVAASLVGALALGTLDALAAGSDGPVGEAIRFAGNVSRAGVKAAQAADAKFEIGWKARAVATLGIERLFRRARSAEATADVLATAAGPAFVGEVASSEVTPVVRLKPVDPDRPKRAEEAYAAIQLEMGRERLAMAVARSEPSQGGQPPPGGWRSLASVRFFDALRAVRRGEMRKRDFFRSRWLRTLRWSSRFIREAEIDNCLMEAADNSKVASECFKPP